MTMLRSMTLLLATLLLLGAQVSGVTEEKQTEQSSQAHGKASPPASPPAAKSSSAADTDYSATLCDIVKNLPPVSLPSDPKTVQDPVAVCAVIGTAFKDQPDLLTKDIRPLSEDFSHFESFFRLLTNTQLCESTENDDINTITAKAAVLAFVKDLNIEVQTMVGGTEDELLARAPAYIIPAALFTEQFYAITNEMAAAGLDGTPKALVRIESCHTLAVKVNEFPEDVVHRNGMALLQVFKAYVEATHPAVAQYFQYSHDMSENYHEKTSWLAQRIGESLDRCLGCEEGDRLINWTPPPDSMYKLMKTMAERGHKHGHKFEAKCECELREKIPGCGAAKPAPVQAQDLATRLSDSEHATNAFHGMWRSKDIPAWFMDFSVADKTITVGRESQTQEPDYSRYEITDIVGDKLQYLRTQTTSGSAFTSGSQRLITARINDDGTLVIEDTGAVYVRDESQQAEATLDSSTPSPSATEPENTVDAWKRCYVTRNALDYACLHTLIGHDVIGLAKEGSDQAATSVPTLGSTELLSTPTWNPDMIVTFGGSPEREFNKVRMAVVGNIRPQSDEVIVRPMMHRNILKTIGRNPVYYRDPKDITAQEFAEGKTMKGKMKDPAFKDMKAVERDVIMMELQDLVFKSEGVKLVDYDEIYIAAIYAALPGNNGELALTSIQTRWYDVVQRNASKKMKQSASTRSAFEKESKKMYEGEKLKKKHLEDKDLVKLAQAKLRTIVASAIHTE